MVGVTGPRSRTRFEFADVYGPLVARGHRFEHAGAQSQQPQGPVDGGMALAVGHHPHRRGALQALLFDVPTDLRQYMVTGGRQGHRVGPLTTSHEAERRPRRQAQDLLQPGPGHVFDHRRRRRGHGVEGGLVPTAGQNIRGRSRLEGTTDHEPEVTRPGRADQGGLDRVGQLFDGLVSRSWPRRQRAQGGAHGFEIHLAREHWAAHHPFVVVSGALGGKDEQVAERGHVRVSHGDLRPPPRPRPGPR